MLEVKAIVKDKDGKESEYTMMWNKDMIKMVCPAADKPEMTKMIMVDGSDVLIAEKYDSLKERLCD